MDSAVSRATIFRLLGACNLTHTLLARTRYGSPYEVHRHRCKCVPGYVLGEFSDDNGEKRARKSCASDTAALPKSSLLRLGKFSVYRKLRGHNVFRRRIPRVLRNTS